MSKEVFRAGYADQYDLLYQEKDYEAECDLLEEMFRRYGDGKIGTILDLGCGTGGHAIPLAKRGYGLTGVDRSPEMLALAARKVAGIRLDDGQSPPTFLEGDLRALDLGKAFDVALMMFAVLSYQRTNEDVLAALHSVRRHLRPGGVFLADIWYGPAVLEIGPSDRYKIVDLEDGQLIRFVTANLDIQNHLCHVHYDLWRLEEGRLASRAQEEHGMRFFFPKELELYFHLAELEMLGIHPFPNIAQDIDPSTWNVLVCGRSAA